MATVVLELDRMNTEEIFAYQRFTHLLTNISEGKYETNFLKENLENLTCDAAKLKMMGLMKFLLPKKLITVLQVMQKQISDGVCSKVSSKGPTVVEMNAMKCSLLSLYILTSPDMHKSIYLEDIIDSIIMFMKHQLVHSAEEGSTMKTLCKATQVLHQDLQVAINLIAELIGLQGLTEMATISASSIGVTSFFSQHLSDFQLPSVKLLTAIFMKYENSRMFLLEEIIISLTKLAANKKEPQAYRLNSMEKIHMFSALVLHLIQSIPCLTNIPGEDDCIKEVKLDAIITKKYKNILTVAANFLCELITKCVTKKGKADHQVLFENFIQDLLMIVTKPEWPGAMILLLVLAKVLVTKFQNRNADIYLRVSALEYLGLIIARLRGYATLTEKQLQTLDQIIQDVKEQEEELYGEDRKINTEEERIYFLQNILLNHMSDSDELMRYARHFTITVWYHEIISQNEDNKAMKDKNSHNAESVNHIKTLLRETGNTKNHTINRLTTVQAGVKMSNTQVKKASERASASAKSKHQKKLLLAKIKLETNFKVNAVQTPCISGLRLETILRYLISKGGFNRSFDTYLKYIFHALMESSIPIRSKAMKGLMLIVEADPSVLTRPYVQKGVNCSFLDCSISVREAAVDLVGRFIVKQPEVIDKYYDMLSTRILDTGVSVRKRVIRILSGICIECPEFSKIPEIWLKLLKRVNDKEEGVRKLVIDIFKEMWFVPIPESSAKAGLVTRRASNIITLIDASWNNGQNCFQQLLKHMFYPPNNGMCLRSNAGLPVNLLAACKQIIGCLVENVMKGEECGSFQHMSASLKTLKTFSEVNPYFLVPYVSTLQPYLTLNYKGDYHTIICVVDVMKMTVPLLDHPSEVFLAQIEEDLVKLIMQHNEKVIHSCLSCLATIVNNITHNFQLVRDCFMKFYGHVKCFKNCHQNKPESPILIKYHSFLKRAILTIGVLVRHFDFTSKSIAEGLETNIIDGLVEVFVYFMQHSRSDVQYFTMKAIGAASVRHYDIMLQPVVKTFYQCTLRNENASPEMKIQVLTNLFTYLQEEEEEMIRQEKNLKNIPDNNLSETNYSVSGMASTITQIFKEEIVLCCMHSSVSVRLAVANVLQLILQQGLLQPIKILPHLIYLSTDQQESVSQVAQKLLNEEEVMHPSTIPSIMCPSVSLVYNFQKMIQTKAPVIRGFVEESQKALLSCVYTAIRKHKINRRSFVTFVISQFDNKISDLSKMLFLSDNLAYFTYEVYDEVFFIIHTIDIHLSTVGFDYLKDFQQALLLKKKDVQEDGEVWDEDKDEESIETLINCVPDDTSVLQKCVLAFQGCLLLVLLKHHLMQMYSINNGTLLEYSPNQPSKTHDKILSRKNGLTFKPVAILKKLLKEDKCHAGIMEQKQALIEQYLEFKHLIHEFDNSEQDDSLTWSASNDLHTTTKVNSRSLQRTSNVLFKAPNEVKVSQKQMFSAKRRKCQNKENIKRPKNA